MELDSDELTVKEDMFDWMTLKTKIKDAKLKCVIEFMLLIKKTSNAVTEEVKPRFGVGYVLVPVLYEGE